MLIPILYLKGVSTGDFEEALSALLGKEAGGLSASTIGRLKEVWSEEHARWSKRDLSVKRYVYFWVDGIHVQARLEDAAQCLLVIIGATPEGKKELVGLIDGVRESAQSWKELLLDCVRSRIAGARGVVMIEMRRAQLSFGDGLIADEVSNLREGWMEPADQVLADDEIVAAVHEALARRHPKSRSRGRHGTPAEVVLRLLFSSTCAM